MESDVPKCRRCGEPLLLTPYDKTYVNPCFECYLEESKDWGASTSHAQEVERIHKEVYRGE